MVIGPTYRDDEMAEVQKKPDEVSEVSMDEFLSNSATKSFINEWKSRGFTKRGVVELLLLLYPLYKQLGVQGVLSKAKKLLEKLSGMDELRDVLSSLKLRPEKKNE
ncbi:MAG: hypothetical protein QW035_03200 [Candidatus Anstonellales archaeon]